MLGDAPRAYTQVSTTERLYQGEILSNVVERTVRFVEGTEGADEFGFAEVVHPYAILVTQDCDLEQDARARNTPSLEEGKRRNALLPSVLLVVASVFETASGLGGSDIKRRAKQNKDERYQFLASVPADVDSQGGGVPALLLDFKRHFTYPMDQVLLAVQRGETTRRARLSSPYAEHLSSRFGYFMQRIGLPRDHHDFEP